MIDSSIESSWAPADCSQYHRVGTSSASALSLSLSMWSTGNAYTGREGSSPCSAGYGPLMGARGRVPSRPPGARRPAGRAAWDLGFTCPRASAVGRAPPRPYVVGGVFGPAPSRPSIVDSRWCGRAPAGPNPSSMISSSARAHGVARRPARTYDASVWTPRGACCPPALALHARVLLGWDGWDRCTVGSRSGGLFMCPCWLRQVHLHAARSGLRSRRGRHRRRAVPRWPLLQVQFLCPCHCHVLFFKHPAGIIFRLAEWQI